MFSKYCSPFVLIALAFAINAHASEEAKRLSKAPWSAEKKYFGRDAFVPDWRKGDEIDAKASAFFLKRHWSKYRAEHEAGNQGVLPEWIGEEEKKAGVVVFPVDYIRQVLPSVIPTKEECQVTAMASFAALGESEPFPIAVRTLARAREVSLDVSDLKGPGVITAQDITTRLCLAFKFGFFMPKGSKARLWHKHIKPAIMFRPPEGKWTFPPNFTMVYWVDVHVPLDAKPGKYSGMIGIRVDGKMVKQIRTSVEVLPFRLKANNYRAGTFGCTGNQLGNGFKGYYEEMMEMDSRYGYGMAAAFKNKSKEIPWIGRLEKMTLDEKSHLFTRIDEKMNLLKKYGLGDVMFWNIAGADFHARFDAQVKRYTGHSLKTREGKIGFAHMMRALKAAEKKHGWAEIVINPVDESLDNPDYTRELIAAMPYIHTISPETRIYMTEWKVGYTRLYQSHGETLRGRRRPDKGRKTKEYLGLKGKEPIFNFHVIGANKQDDEARGIQDAFNGEYWNYGILARVSPHARYIQGFKTWITRAEASLLWCGWGCSFDYYPQGKWTSHFLMSELPAKTARSKRNTRGPVLASCKAAVAREGIDDRHYVETLRFHATKAGSNADLDFLRNVLPGKCREMATGFAQMGGRYNVGVEVKDTHAMQKLRIEIKDRILKILSRSSAGNELSALPSDNGR